VKIGEQTDWSAHLATYEAGGVAAGRAHLQAEHANAVRAFQQVHPDSGWWIAAELHRRLHGLEEAKK
jgi:hypothetical protein